MEGVGLKNVYLVQAGEKSLVNNTIAYLPYAAGTIAGLLCLGYPFHPLGRPEKLRTGHLETLQVPALIVQGTRDPMGTREEVATYTLSPSIRLLWLDDGDHDHELDEREAAPILTETKFAGDAHVLSVLLV